MPTTLAQRQAAYAILAAAPTDVRALRERVTAQVADIEQDGRWAPEHRGRLVAQAREHGAGAVATLRDQVSGAQDTLLRGAEEMDEAARGGSDTARLARATEQGQAWARLRPQLDAGRSWHSLLAEAEDARDATSVLALVDEVPAYVAATTGKPADPELFGRLDRAVARALGDDQGRGSAARARAHVQAQGPVAAAELDWTASVVSGQRAGLSAAIGVQQAQARAEAIGREVAGSPQPAA